MAEKKLEETTKRAKQNEEEAKNLSARAAQAEGKLKEAEQTAREQSARVAQAQKEKKDAELDKADAEEEVEKAEKEAKKWEGFGESMQVAKEGMKAAMQMTNAGTTKKP